MEERPGSGDALDLQRRIERLEHELDQVQAWCVGLEAHLAEVLALLRLLGLRRDG